MATYLFMMMLCLFQQDLYYLWKDFFWGKTQQVIQPKDAAIRYGVIQHKRLKPMSLKRLEKYLHTNKKNCHVYVSLRVVCALFQINNHSALCIALLLRKVLNINVGCVGVAKWYHCIPVPYLALWTYVSTMLRSNYSILYMALNERPCCLYI